MAIGDTIKTYNGDGVTNTFAIPFAYTNQSEVVVSRNNGPVTYTFPNASTIQITSPTVLAIGDKLTITRVTPIDTAAVTFRNGSSTPGDQFNVIFQQILRGLQEVRDKVASTVTFVADAAYNFGGKRLTNVAEPTNSVDAATKNYVDVISAGDRAYALGLSVSSGGVPGPGAGNVGNWLKATGAAAWAWTQITISDVASLATSLAAKAPIDNPAFTTGATISPATGVQFPNQLDLTPSTHATSRRIAVKFDQWFAAQDIAGNGTKDFGIYSTQAGAWALTFDASANATAQFLGSVGVKGPAIVMNTISTTFPYIQMDTGDYIGFDRTGNSFSFNIGNVTKGGFNATGVYGDGSQLTNLPSPTFGAVNYEGLMHNAGGSSVAAGANASTVRFGYSAGPTASGTWQNTGTSPVASGAVGWFKRIA